MKAILFIIVLFNIIPAYTQNKKTGKVIFEKILAASLKGNKGGENPFRSVTVYLPPGYDTSTRHYPVIYYLHGFQMNDTMFIEGAQFDKLMDEAIVSGKIRPAILVIPNEYTLFQGSFYTNSSLTGNWEDFTVKELVGFIDKKYRTISDRNSRGLAGISMGGYGTLKLGMLHPDVFGVIYAESPATLGMYMDINIYNPSMKTAQEAKNIDDLSKDYYAMGFVAMARAFSPNPNKAPFYCDLPIAYKNDRISVNYDALKKWENNFPLNMIDNHVKELKSLNAIKIDWGRNDEFDHIPITSLLFSQKLEALGINHEAEMYLGDHSHKVWGPDGRWYNALLPFFDHNLKF
jgi:S-formylglutathione hydrolase FrmB